MHDGATNSMKASTRMLLTLAMVCLSYLSVASKRQPPLTQIKASPVELDAFSHTLIGALRRHSLAKAETLVHIVGASEVEVQVDWTTVCKMGVRMLLVGPRVDLDKLQNGAPPCLAAVRDYYSLKTAQNSATAKEEFLQTPDILIGFNLDIYMPYWRRTVADMLQQRVPVVITMYCEYEGYKFDRFLKWPEIEFTPTALGASPSSQEILQVGEGFVPSVEYLWKFAANPHAHAEPISCYSDAVMKGEKHGTRNSYWVSIRGTPDPPANDL